MDGRKRGVSAETARIRVEEALKQDPKGFVFLSKLEVEQNLDERRRARYVEAGAPHGWLGPDHTYDMKCKRGCPSHCTNPDCLYPRYFARRDRVAA
jgi:hypothetical protein